MGRIRTMGAWIQDQLKYNGEMFGRVCSMLSLSFLVVRTHMLHSKKVLLALRIALRWNLPLWKVTREWWALAGSSSDVWVWFCWVWLLYYSPSTRWRVRSIKGEQRARHTHPIIEMTYEHLDVAIEDGYRKYWNRRRGLPFPLPFFWKSWSESCHLGLKVEQVVASIGYSQPYIQATDTSPFSP